MPWAGRSSPGAQSESVAPLPDSLHFNDVGEVIATTVTEDISAGSLAWEPSQPRPRFIADTRTVEKTWGGSISDLIKTYTAYVTIAPRPPGLQQGMAGRVEIVVELDPEALSIEQKTWLNQR